MQQRLENLVFVYGSLKKGFHNNYFLDNSKFIGENKTLGKHRMISLGGFPGVIWCGGSGGAFKDRGTAQIHGEIWQVNSERDRRRLDMLEGYPNFYDKQDIYTQWGKATMYVLSKEFLSDEKYLNQPTIDTGVWKDAS